MSIIRSQLVGDVVSGATFAGVVTATVFQGNGNLGILTASTIGAGIVTATVFQGNANIGILTASTVSAGNTTGVAGQYLQSTGAGVTWSNISSFQGNANIGILTASTVSAGNTTGSSGQYLQSTGTGVTWSNIAFPQVGDSILLGYNNAGIRSDGGNGRLEVFGSGNFRVFTSSGTFVVNPGISSIRVRVVGGGGAGGAGGGFYQNIPVDAYPNYQFASGSGGGGGGGGYAHKVINSFTAPRSYVVTVGTNGGTSSFGSEVSATGGSAGSNGSFNPSGPGTPGIGGTGGIGIGGDVNYVGASGTSGFPLSASLTGTPLGVIPSIGGWGGASATQLGNGSGINVPGLPSRSKGTFIIDNTYVNRFPYDIFNGIQGQAPTSPNPQGLSVLITQLYSVDGYNGGGGYVSPSGGSIGRGGIGGGAAGGYQSELGGGSGGQGGAFPALNPGAPPVSNIIYTPGTPNSGSSGVVIVEW